MVARIAKLSSATLVVKAVLFSGQVLAKPDLNDTVKVKAQALSQGGFIQGSVDNCVTYQLNDQGNNCGPKGEFIVGFGRDAQTKQTISFTLEDGSSFTYDVKLTKREYDVQKIEGVAKKMVTPPESVYTRIKNDNLKIGKARVHNSEHLYFTQDFIWPAEGRISGVYGSQRVFNGVPKRPHFGLDVANAIGTQVVAPADGIVRLAHNDMYYSGGTLILDHGYGITSTYIHLSKIEVNEGDSVKQGELIARIGNTGRVTGPHLDWRINWFKERLDPAFWVPERK